jgi:NADPH2:quinone reductase
VNRPDVLQRKGNYNPPPGASDIPGLEVSGTIIGGDPDALAAMKFALGDRVCALTNGGGYAQVLKLKHTVVRYFHRRVSPTVCLSVR